MVTRVLWFHPRPLLPPQGGGDLRTLGLVTEVVAAGHEVLVVTAGAPAEQPDAFDVCPVACRVGLTGAIAKAASRFPLRSPRPLPASLERARRRIDDFQPQVGVVSEVMTGSLALPLLPGGMPWIYDAQNVEHELFRRLASEAHGMVDRVTFAVDRGRVRRAERALVRAASAVVAVSFDDASGLSALAPSLQPLVVPSSVPTPSQPAHPGENAQILLFVGTLNYPPNVAAVRELVETIFPKVRERVPLARLVVAGRNPAPELRSLLGGSVGVELLSDVPDLAPLYRSARCVVLPIRYGGGSRLKVYEAFAWGQATVGTAAAFAGISLPPGACLVAERTDEFVDAIHMVLTDDSAAAGLGASAHAYFVSELSLPAATRPLVDLVEELARA